MGWPKCCEVEGHNCRMDKNATIFHTCKKEKYMRSHVSFAQAQRGCKARIFLLLQSPGAVCLSAVWLSDFLSWKLQF